MLSMGIVVAFSLIACTYTAPESGRNVLHELAETAGLSNPDIKIDDVDSGVQYEKIGIQAEGISDLAEKSSGDVAEVKAGPNRGLVSDVIESTLSGVHLGFAIGSNTNGTIDRICIKLGNVTLAGCRRTAAEDKNISTDDQQNEIKGRKHANHD